MVACQRESIGDTLLNSMIVGQPEANIVSRTTVGHGNSSERKAMCDDCRPSHQNCRSEKSGASGEIRSLKHLFLIQAATGLGCPEYGPTLRTRSGRSAALEPLECALGLLEIRGAFLKFRTVDFRALIKTGILNGRGGWNCDQFCQP